jgi:DinB superfamily
MDYYGPKELAESFRTVRRNTIRIAEDVPEEKYGFRATPDTRTVGDMLGLIAVATRDAHQAHAVERIKSYVGVDFAALGRRREEQAARLATKAAILAALREEGDKWAAYLESVSEEALAERVHFSPEITPPSKSRFEILLSVKEQEMHNRAQLMLIQRMLGIVPHLTREREARLAEIAKSKTAQT